MARYRARFSINSPKDKWLGQGSQDFYAQSKGLAKEQPRLLVRQELEPVVDQIAFGGDDGIRVYPGGAAPKPRDNSICVTHVRACFWVPLMRV